MPANYPAAVYDPRTKTNKSGVVYNPALSDVGFAEDVSKLDDEVVAIQNSVGILNGIVLDVLAKSYYSEDNLPLWNAPASLIDWNIQNVAPYRMPPCTVKKITVALSEAIPAGITLNFYTQKDGVDIHAALPITSASPLSQDIVLDSAFAGGEGLKYYITTDNEDTPIDITITITLTVDRVGFLFHMAYHKVVEDLLKPFDTIEVVDDAGHSYNNSTVLSSNSVLQIDYEANSFYEFYALINVKTAVAPQYKYQLTHDANAVLAFRAEPDVITVNEKVGNTPYEILAVSGTHTLLLLHGVLSTGETGGTLIFQSAQKTSNAAYCGEKERSLMRLRKIG
jgi:hypothetical protein